MEASDHADPRDSDRPVGGAYVEERPPKPNRHVARSPYLNRPETAIDPIDAARARWDYDRLCRVARRELTAAERWALFMGPLTNRTRRQLAAESGLSEVRLARLAVRGRAKLREAVAREFDADALALYAVGAASRAERLRAEELLARYPLSCAASGLEVRRVARRRPQREGARRS
jgi:hypothetical protein